MDTKGLNKGTSYNGLLVGNNEFMLTSNHFLKPLV